MNEHINDIEPLVEVPDYSFAIYVGGCIFGVIIFFVIFLFVLSLFKNRKKERKKLLKYRLGSINFSNPKKDAYLITQIAREIVENNKSFEAFIELLKSLQKYKYKKEIPNVDVKTKERFKTFLKSLNV